MTCSSRDEVAGAFNCRTSGLTDSTSRVFLFPLADTGHRTLPLSARSVSSKCVCNESVFLFPLALRSTLFNTSDESATRNLSC